MQISSRDRLFLAATGITAALSVVLPAQAATARQQYAIPTQPLDDAIQALAKASGQGIVAPSALVEGRTSAPVAGNFTVMEALDRLLVGTGLQAMVVGNSLIVKPSGSTALDSPDILVTGTRIRGSGPVGSNLISIDRTSIERSGYATTQQILQALPQNFGGGANEGTVGFSVRNNTNSNFGFGSSANLRGLGTTSTLVLVDGNRMALGGGSGIFVDLTLIPSTAIERIEILADGASALYGSDAVAGVINVRLRRDFEGGDSRFRYGFGQGFSDLQASQLLGLRWASGSVSLGYEFYRRTRLGADQRAFVTEDLRAFGGPDYRKTFANPGTILAGGRRFAIPGGQDGRSLTAADLRPDAVNLSDGRDQTDVLPAITRNAVYAAIEQDLASWLKLSAKGFFADRQSTTRTFPDNAGTVTVPASNPFYVDPIGTGLPVTVNYNFVPDLGPMTLKANARNWAAVGGLEAAIGQWSGSVSGSYGVQTETGRNSNIPNYFLLARALADPDLATAFNVFGDGSFTNPQTIAGIRGSFEQTGRSRIGTANLKFEGPLAEMPAGDIRLAVGGEFRRERYEFSAISFENSAVPVMRGMDVGPMRRSIAAGYAEMLVPLVAPEQNVTGVARLDLLLAGRVEHYSDFGTTANPRIGVRWQPAADVTLRGSFGTSFRAPTFNDIRTGRGTRQYVPFRLADPSSPTGTTNALLLFGANSDLGPERATSWTAGIDVAPVAAPGLRLSLTYFDIAYRDRIATLAADFASFLTNRALYQNILTDNPDPAVVAAFYADENFVNPFGIAAADIAVLADGRTRNLARVHQQGLDFDLGYRFRRGGVDYDLGVSGAWLFGIDQQITPTAPVTDIASTIGNPVDLRLRGRLGASVDGVTISGFVNFVDGYRNNGVTPIERVDSWTTVDLQLAYDLGRERGPLKGVKLAISATNVFDRDPPYVNNPTIFSASGFDPENASALGRVIALQLGKTW